MLIFFKRALIAFTTCSVFFYAVAGFSGPKIVEVGLFSMGSVGQVFPEGWEPLVFKKIKQHTAYSLVKDDGVVVVRADSESSSSGLIRKIEIDPEQFPVIKWRWKAAGVYEKGDVTRKKGDDYPARIYVTFKYDPTKLSAWDRTKYKAAKMIHGQYPPQGAINYIWASKAPVGTVVPNPYTDKVKMIVVESGKDKLGTWVEESRNIADDYRKAFGHSPPPISGIGIMTDTDNTGEKTVSYYGDIVFEAQ